MDRIVGQYEAGLDGSGFPSCRFNEICQCLDRSDRDHGKDVLEHPTGCSDGGPLSFHRCGLGEPKHRRQWRVMLGLSVQLVSVVQSVSQSSLWLAQCRRWLEGLVRLS